MTVTLTALLFSGFFGWGLYVMFRALTQPGVSLEAELDRVTSPLPYDNALGSRIQRLGSLGVTELPTADLEVLGWTSPEWYQRRLTFVGSGIGIGVLIALFLRMLASFPLLLAIPALGLLAGGLALLAVDSDRSTQADRVREDVRAALTHYLELTSIMLAGGAGAETALEEAVSQGHGVGFNMFAREVARAKENPGMSAFTALRDLGTRIAVAELVEFGNVMILSSENAATVRQALDEKATQIVFREQEKRRSEALSRNVLMSIPVVGMAAGFILWLVYPAVAGLAGA